MTDHHQISNDPSREDVEMLLPWYVNGTLDRQDAARVEAYLDQHPDLDVQLVAAREDMDQSIRANEAIVGPSAMAFERLMERVEAEAPMRHRAAAAGRGVMASVDEFLKALSPGRLGWAAMAAAAVIMVQAGVVGSMLLNQTSGEKTYQTASGGKALEGTFVLVKFQETAPMAQVSSYLEQHDAEIVGGPKPGGLFRVRISAEKLNDELKLALIKKLQANGQLVNMVLPSQ